MLQVLEQTDENLIAIRIGGTVSSQDYNVLRTLLNDRLPAHDGLRWYVEMAAFDSWGSQTLWEKFKLDLHLADQTPLSRVAMVGDKNWEDWIAPIWKWLGAVYPLQPNEIKFFPLERRETALTWIVAT